MDNEIDREVELNQGPGVSGQEVEKAILDLKVFLGFKMSGRGRQSPDGRIEKARQRLEDLKNALARNPSEENSELINKIELALKP